MKEYDKKRLQESDGSQGQATHVAYRGRVIDVGNSPLWKGGLHMGRHRAGNDLTTDFQAAPHGPEVFDRYPQVGILQAEESVQRPMPAMVGRLLARLPILKRHPHPMLVHFPIVFPISTVFFTLLFLATRIRSFDITALHCMGGGILFTPLGMATGWFTWWLNYYKKPLRAVSIKIRYSFLLLAMLLVAFLWRIAMPDIPAPWGIVSLLYLLLIISLLPVVTVIGWFGASLTFPIEKG
jgi:predicted heme/steroid binding protein/uncharacterized membrane protein